MSTKNKADNVVRLSERQSVPEIVRTVSLPGGDVLTVRMNQRTLRKVLRKHLDLLKRHERICAEQLAELTGRPASDFLKKQVPASATFAAVMAAFESNTGGESDGGTCH